ncbi:MAG TPA: Ig domain-containing protein [Chlamydiales bacterium]|nr:Ig domain-containing protein [Chlamydiales bacterium]
MWRLLFIALLFAQSFIGSDNILLPNIQLYLTPSTSDYGTFSFLGELGAKNFRGSGTYGVYFTPCQRIKFTGEFLTQKLHYHFSSHGQSKWNSQYALGGEYQYLLPSSAFQSIDLGGYYSHAFNKHISATRRIAGSDAGSCYFGTTVKLTNYAYLSADANYDYVNYHRHLQDRKVASGWGGSFGFVQCFSNDITLNFEAEFRRPFFFYEGILNWNRRFTNWDLNCGIYGNFTDGKEGLPNVIAGGFQIGFSFGGCDTPCCRTSSCDCQPCTAPISLCNCQPVSCEDDCNRRLYCDLASWVMTPAVYVPVVQAISDSATCALPTSTTIPFQVAEGGGPFSFATGGFFSSTTPLTFSATGLPAGLSINPSTGLISGTIGFAGSTVTVTATNACGSTSQSFLILIPI